MGRGGPPPAHARVWHADHRKTLRIKIPHYLRPTFEKGAGMPGEPEPHYCFHRSLSDLLSACFGAGFVLDGLEEPAFAGPIRSDLVLNWGHYPDIPPVLACRLRPLEK